MAPGLHGSICKIRWVEFLFSGFFGFFPLYRIGRERRWKHSELKAKSAYPLHYSTLCGHFPAYFSPKQLSGFSPSPVCCQLETGAAEGHSCSPGVNTEVLLSFSLIAHLWFPALRLALARPRETGSQPRTSRCPHLVTVFHSFVHRVLVI